MTQECLEDAVEEAIAGNRIGDIGWAVQEHAEASGYGVVQGAGRPRGRVPACTSRRKCPTTGGRATGVKLVAGMVLAIEPMINLGKKQVVQESDGWTIATADGLPSAHFEHDVVVREGKSEVLSTFKWIEEALGAVQEG